MEQKKYIETYENLKIAIIGLGYVGLPLFVNYLNCILALDMMWIIIESMNCLMELILEIM